MHSIKYKEKIQKNVRGDFIIGTGGKFTLMNKKKDKVILDSLTHINELAEIYYDQNFGSSDDNKNENVPNYKRFHKYMCK